jgi:hypothetical protein
MPRTARVNYALVPWRRPRSDYSVGDAAFGCISRQLENLSLARGGGAAKLSASLGLGWRKEIHIFPAWLKSNIKGICFKYAARTLYRLCPAPIDAGWTRTRAPRDH